MQPNLCLLQKWVRLRNNYFSAYSLSAACESSVSQVKPCVRLIRRVHKRVYSRLNLEISAAALPLRVANRKSPVNLLRLLTAPHHSASVCCDMIPKVFPFEPLLRQWRTNCFEGMKYMKYVSVKGLIHLGWCCSIIIRYTDSCISQYADSH